MIHDDLHRLVVRVLGTRDDELDLDGAQGTLAAYADAMARGENDPERFGRMIAHLAQSPETADVLETLVALARMERIGGLPEAAALWDEVRAAARGTASHSRKSARAEAKGATGVPKRESAPGRWWPTLSRLVWPKAAGAARALVPVTAVLALMFTSTGWWRSEQRARQASSELRGLQTALSRIDDPSVGVANRYGVSTAPTDADYRGLVETVGNAREIRFSLGADGAWLRVVFAPGHRRALVWAGDLPPLERDRRYDCYLVDNGGGRHPLRMLESLQGDTVWWYVEAERALDAYAALAMASGPEDEAVVQVALAAE